MKSLNSRKLYRLRRVAAGPVSFEVDGERLTKAGDRHVFMASTYRTMLRYGWAMEVL